MICKRLMRSKSVHQRRSVPCHGAESPLANVGDLFLTRLSRLDNDAGLAAILRTVKQLYGGRRYIIIPLKSGRREWSAQITPTPTSSSSSSPSPCSSPWRDNLGFTRRAREGRFTIHKTTRRIELSSLALRQLPPVAGGRRESA